MHTYKYKEAFLVSNDWDDEKNNYATNEWLAYFKEHRERWGYTENTNTHRYEVRVKHGGDWEVLKFSHRPDATAELKKMLSNNVCAVLVEATQ
jgi:hypothetical protein